MWRKIKNAYHLGTAISANVRFGYPSERLTVIGVTGTDGKTTTVSLIYHILKKSGKKVAVISTLGAQINDRKYDIGFHVTTPSPFQLQSYIKKAVDGGCEYLVLEVTSHALDQNRVWGVNFDIGVLTNITHEHLDYHKNYEDYVETKLKLLTMSKIAVLNKDDQSYSFINSKLKNQKSKLQLKTQKLITFGSGTYVDINFQKFPFKTNMIGEFNKYNCLAAIAVCRALGLGDEQIRNAVLSFEPPVGREEIVYDKDFKVMIDFAHTPNAFVQLLPEVGKLTKGRLIHVFGAAAERDTSKRPKMGKISSEYSDIIILTSEDPRSESAEKIMNQIQSEISNAKFQMPNFKLLRTNNYEPNTKEKYLFKIPDRRKAIEFAISIAQSGDLVLLTGKGHEKSMNYGNGEEPWDEYDVVKEALVLRNKN